ncbi:MAG: alpha/beta fold hydrolase [Synechococcaceae cyanobacterium]|nr:alpha/beta fold hydrolase [Synechococcaceae cyanobacterium]
MHDDPQPARRPPEHHRQAPDRPPEPDGGAHRCRDRSTGWGHHGTWIWQGLPCHWRRLGDPRRPALVLLHGFGAGSGHWRHNAAELVEAGWCVYGLDLLGFGASHQPALQRWRPLDNRLWARQLQAFLEQVVGRAAVLIGHSLGGLVALSCAVFHPGWVQAVVAAPLPDPALMAAPSPPGRSRRCPRWWRRLRRILVRLLCRLLPLELIVPLLVHSPLLDLGLQSAYRHPVIGDPELRRVISRPARRPGAVGSLRAMSIAMALRPQAATAPALLARLRRPLLLIWGRQDGLVPLAVARVCQESCPALSLVVLDDCGHCPHDECPEPFHRALLDWLGGLGLPA